MKIFSILTQSGSMKLPIFAFGMAFLALIPVKAKAPYQGADKGIQIQTLTEGGASWDNIPYKAYPSAPPRLTVFKITLAPNSTLPWHTHGIPVAAYVLSGKLTIEEKAGKTKVVNTGEAVLESMNNIHRGKTGSETTELIVFYAGALGLPLAETVPR